MLEATNNLRIPAVFLSTMKPDSETNPPTWINECFVSSSMQQRLMNVLLHSTRKND